MQMVRAMHAKFMQVQQLSFALTFVRFWVPKIIMTKTLAVETFSEEEHLTEPFSVF